MTHFYKGFIFIIFYFGLISCGGNAEIEKPKEKGGESIIDSLNLENEPSIDVPIPDNELGPIADIAEYRGKIEDKYTWTDELGKNYIIVTEYKSANGKEVDIDSEEWINDPSFDKYPDYSEICLKSYIVQENSYSQLYEFCDEKKQALTTIEYIGNSLEVKDIDGDGQVELIYAYKVVPDGLDPADVTMMVSYKSDKNFIRGILPVAESDFDLAFKMNYDSDFNDLPPTIKKYVQKKWRRMMLAQKGK